MSQFWLIAVLSVFVVAVVFSGVLIPQILLIAFKKRLFDHVDGRKIHHGTVPRLGGMAFMPVVILSVSLLLGVTLVFDSTEVLMCLVSDMKSIAFLTSAVIVIYLVGLADDLIGVRYRGKFVAQIISGMLLLASGLCACHFYGALFIGDVPHWLGALFTVFLVVYVVNAINFIDGVDGLASGMSAIAFLCYGATFFIVGEYIYAAIAFAVLGTVVPFFYFNVFGDAKKRKKIFMGDTGSLTLGLLLCFFAVKLSQIGATVKDVNPMVLAYVPLFIPCIDVVRVVVGRIRRGANPFKPDQTHIHHKMMATGLSQRVVMVLILAMSMALILLNIVLSQVLDVNLILLFDILLWLGLNVVLSRFKKNRRDCDVTSQNTD